MAKVITKKRPNRTGRRKPKAGKSKSLTELNAWMTANYATLMSDARQNCVRLTGKPTFGGAKRRKSA